MKKKIMAVFGTRPEAIKLAPLLAILKGSAAVELKICVSGQHREMLDQVLQQFNIIPDVDLDIMSPAQHLSELHARLLPPLCAVFTRFQPDLVLLHGDTTTALVAGLAAYYQQIPVAHIEAGLRSGDPLAPYPEEINRRLLAVLSRYHFAPTEQAKQNLVAEGVAAERIWVTGNTVIDALFGILQKIRQNQPLATHLATRFAFLDPDKKWVLVTGHRRENLGQGLTEICHALSGLAEQYPNVQWLFPLHLNPNVRETVAKILGGRKNLFLLEPLPYAEFIYVMDRAELIITDSGGIQEEASALVKPLVLLRETTERSEAVEAGLVMPVGTDRAKIIDTVGQLLTHHPEIDYRKLTHLYGDGRAAERIAMILTEGLSQNVSI